MSHVPPANQLRSHCELKKARGSFHSYIGGAVASNLRLVIDRNVVGHADSFAFSRPSALEVSRPGGLFLALLLSSMDKE